MASQGDLYIHMTDGSGNTRLADINLIANIIIPIGTIIAWGGPLETIPKGWFICDGQNGTHDLRGRSIAMPIHNATLDNTRIGLGLGGYWGEANTVMTEAQMPSHTHSYLGFSPAPYAENADPRAIAVPTNKETGAKGGNQAQNNIHPVVAVWYIQKVWNSFSTEWAPTQALHK